MEVHYVIAQYNEDISWADNLDKTVIKKGVDMPNLGRESSSYLFFILNNYEKLDGWYYFVQGDPFDHGFPDKRKIISSTPIEEPRHTSANEQLKLHILCDKLGLPLKQKYDYIVGANFMVHSDEIRKYSFEWYAKIFLLSLEHKTGWELERLWLTIFPNSK